MKPIIIAFISLLLTGCATFGQPTRSPIAECRKACSRGDLDFYLDEVTECRCRRKYEVLNDKN